MIQIIIEFPIKKLGGDYSDIFITLTDDAESSCTISMGYLANDNKIIGVNSVYDSESCFGFRDNSKIEQRNV